MLEKIKAKIRGTINLDKLKKDGLIVGRNFKAMEGTIIDQGHCWLIEIGDNVTLAPRVHILAHDASTKCTLNYTKIGCVSIGDNVFVGAGTIILPGVSIASNTIIGAGSVVRKNLESGVWCGNPCEFICSYEEYIQRHQSIVDGKVKPYYDEKWTYDQITDEMKKKMKEEVKKYNGGYVI